MRYEIKNSTSTYENVYYLIDNLSNKRTLAFTSIEEVLSVKAAPMYPPLSEDLTTNTIEAFNDVEQLMSKLLAAPDYVARQILRTNDPFYRKILQTICADEEAVRTRYPELFI